MLVVCPASLKINWRNELKKWRVRPLKVAVQMPGDPWIGDSCNIVVLNYELLGKFPQVFAEEWDLLVADEAHFVKNPKSLRTKLLLGAVKQVDRDRYPGVRARRRVFMTGTPILNRPIEIFPLLESLQPGKWTFKDKVRYCAGFKGGWGWDFTGASNLDDLQRRLRENVMCRRLKSEVLKELPPKRRQIIEMDANGASSAVQKERAVFDRHESIILGLAAKVELAKASDDEGSYEEAARALSAAYAVAFSEVAKVRHDVALAKVQKVIEHCENLLEDCGKLVLFAHHLDVIEKYRVGLKDHGVLVITGETAQNDRQDIVDQFNAGSAAKVLLLGIMAAGIGLSIKASVEVFAELEWTPGVVAQAEDRCHGVGRGIEGEPLMVQHLVLEGSIDAHMVKAIVEKQAIADKALDDKTVEVLSEPVTLFQKAPPSASRKQLDEDALLITAEQNKAVLRGLQLLSGVCDMAFKLDGCGFNKLDAAIGHLLAEQGWLSPRQAALGRKIARKYVRQLGEDLVKSMGEC